MIFNFRLVSNEVDNFKREIKIDGEATFLDLKNAIMEAVQYDNNEMCSFFLCDSGWEKEKEITLEDMGADNDEDIYLMDECTLSDYIEDEGQKLLFVFDYMTDRCFFLEMKEMITGRNLKDPICTLSLGTPPPQHVELSPFDEEIVVKPVGKVTTIDDFNDEFDEEGYNPDEFDPEGYGEVTFDDKF